jgi:hypothetical protein
MAQPPSSPRLASRETEQLIELLRACDATVQAGAQYQKDQSALLDKHKALLEHQAARVGELEASAKIDNRLIWFIAGMLTAGLTTYLVRK